MIDPNIALGVKPPQVANPMEQYTRALNLLQLRQQVQDAPLRRQAAEEQLRSHQLANQAAQTDMDEERAFKEAVSKGALPAELLRVAPTKAIPYFKSQIEQEKAKIDAAKQKTAMLSNALGSVQYAPEAERAQRYAAVRTEAINQGIIKPEDAPEQYDPAFVDQHFRAALDADKQIDNNRQELERAQRIVEAAPKTAKEWMDLTLREGSATRSQAELDQTRQSLESMGVPKGLLDRTLPQMWSQSAVEQLGRRAMTPEQRASADQAKANAARQAMPNTETELAIWKNDPKRTPEERAWAAQAEKDLLRQKQAGRAVTNVGYGNGIGNDDPKLIAQAIIEGNQPPELKGLYRMQVPVRAELERKGFNLTVATRDWAAIQKHLSTLNGAQQERLRQAVTFTYDSLDQVERLYGDWKKAAGVSGVKLFNRAALAASKQLPGKAGAVAHDLEAAIADLASELGTVYKGGNSSTDETLKLAATNLHSEWNDETFNRNLKRLRESLQYRKNSILSSAPVGVSPNSPYTPPGMSGAQSGGSQPVEQWGRDANGRLVKK